MIGKEAIEYIHTIPRFVRPLGNANLEKLLKVLGCPQNDLKFIHIAGTNGKGSCAAMTASILSAQGYKTGLYTSPYIEVFNERIRINGEMISDDELAYFVERVKTVMLENDALVSEFAFITAVAFEYFREKGCDFVVLETGLGGKLDATNVITKSVVSVLTSISLDHMQYLGDTIEEITLEKCGIIKKNGTVVSYPNDSVIDIIKDECKKKGAKLTVADKPYPLDGGFIYKGKKYPLSLKGLYQPSNAAVVIEIIEAMRQKNIRIKNSALMYGLSHTDWPARFEYVRDNVIIDGGHNIDGISALKKSLLALDKDIVLVMAMMEDKSYEECIKEIAPVAKKVVATQVGIERSLKAETVAETVKSINIPCLVNTDIKGAVEDALSSAGDNGIVCICGSLYLAGEARKIFSKNACK